jgi:hypothetical protein
MKTSYKIALIAVSVIVLAGILFGLYMYNLKPKDLQKVKPDLIMTAVDLQKAFEDNEDAANSKYVNKVIEVTGIIESIKPGDNKTLSISLKTGSPLSSVNCTFQSTPDISKIKVSEQIILRGECSGFLMDVLLNKCVVVQVE